MNNKNMDTTHPTSPEAWRLQLLKLLQANPSLSQRQLAEQLGVSLGKANYCLRALVEKGLVKLGNFSKNPNKGKYAYILTPAGMEEKTRITLGFLRRKEAEFEAIKSEIEVLKGDLESTHAVRSKDAQIENPSSGNAP
jgi:EPS-associated MarR family transcriptional regulator